jgi:hypothetical protein
LIVLLISFFTLLQHYVIKCLAMEDKLSCAGVLTADVDALSKIIKERALLMSESENESPVAAAGFMVLVCSTQS